MSGDSNTKQKCCLGLLYYSQALQAEGQKPVRCGTAVASTLCSRGNVACRLTHAVPLQVCLGVSHAPSERIKLQDNKLLREQHGFKVRPQPVLFV
jgi:hypothetical protein